MSKSKLNQCINAVNNRYSKGLNDDDQVLRMINEDKKTKGHTFLPMYDSYKLITDRERLEGLVEKYGYWSDEVKWFNDILTQKGGFSYMSELNAPHNGTANVKQAELF